MDTIITDMISKAHQALKHAYAPYSKFSVACCIQTYKGNLYTGINVENSSYGLTLCAEASAISAMVTSGEQRIKSMVILAKSNELCSPCGACRQRIHEFSTSDTLIHLCTKNSLLHSFTIEELLPLAFTFNPN
jgi:cytidine deaminase